MPHAKINRKLEPLLRKSKPIKIAIGGRASGKSIGFGDIFTMKMATERADIYCLREYQDTVSDSVHRVFKESIEYRLNLKGWGIFENRIVSPGGACTTYKGANRNPDSMQSAQNYKYSWFEEAHRASQASLDKLLPTIIRNPGSECWFSANPQSANDPFSQRFLVPYQDELDKNGYYEDELHLIVVVNWRDNPWFTEESETLRQWDYEHLSRAKYDWIWEGKYLDEVENSIIKPEWFDAAVDAHKLDRLRAAFEPHGAKIAAHDPFDGGKDAGGYALRHGSIIKSVREKAKGEIDEVCDWATGLATKDGASWFYWDGDGMGTGLKRQISLAFKNTHTRYSMFRGSLSGKAQDNADKIYMPIDGERHENKKTYAETFKNNRAQYYIGNLADRFQNTYRCVAKGLYIDPDKMISLDSEGIENLAKLRSEICRIPRVETPTGLEKVMSKEEMATLDIKSPNLADSVMMATKNPAIVRSKAYIPQPIKVIGAR